MKKCSKCKKKKPTTEFSKDNSRKDGLAHKCKECHKELARDHYEANKDKYKKRRQKVVEETRRYVQELKESNPCSDCGQHFHYCVMDFDHVRGEKKFNVSQTGRFSNLGAVKLEIAKCDLVCANCHRVRTFRRAGH